MRRSLGPLCRNVGRIQAQLRFHGRHSTSIGNPLVDMYGKRTMPSPTKTSSLGASSLRPKVDEAGHKRQKESHLHHQSNHSKGLPKTSIENTIRFSTLPTAKGPPPANFVNTLAAFGGGAMMGDAFLHQLPHAFGDSSHSTHSHSHSHHSHDHDNGGHAHSLKEISTGLCVLAGILLFFMVEKIVRYVEEHGFQTSHSHHHHPKKNDGNAPDCDKSSETEKIPPKNSKKKKAQKNADGSKLVLGYLNLFSDGVHNFTDGMAIGAAFLLYGTKGGWSRTFFLLVHELPQEVGDFGILVRSGFTVFKALAFNFLSALVALAGTAVALVFGANPEQSSVIEAFTAGGFLYISLAGVIPEMHQQGSSIKSTLLQLFALTCGIGTAVAISIAE
ncbi:hypothetical protein SELMODRAFT_424032 [Selaginella moellendorffii]|uniref:ZIP family transporter n=1 Tax=Selaginella moellendorffii TaxID=88036 RepID=D8SNK7_SELML|nr:hypothetical protein SELMODRAFT_424032 [Selaginella moellendorffii]